MERTISETLAEFICRLDFKRIPDQIRDRAKVRTLDFLGVALAGSQIPSSRIMVEVLKAQGGVPESTIIGESERISATNAAMANGTMVHASDFDDDHRSATLHPGAVVFPAALALAERERCNGSRVIEAIVAGYEVACRVGNAFLGTQYHEGFHPTGTCGVFGSAAAAAKILRLSLREIVSAFGIAGTLASGIEEWKTDGSWIKRLHPGRAAQSGLLAALLAQKGYTGPATVFEGKYGFLNAFSFERTFNSAKITESLGEIFVGHETAFKPYPCCRFLHQIIDGTLDIINSEHFTPEEIEKVMIQTFKVAVDTLMHPKERRYRPKTIVDAQFSIPFTVGAALARKRVSLSEFTEAAIGDPEILRLASKVQGEENPEFTRIYPERFPTFIEIRLKDATTLTRYVDLPTGDPAKKDYADNPLKFNKEITAKFRRIVSHIPWFSDREMEVISLVESMENKRDILNLMQFFRRPHN